MPRLGRDAGRQENPNPSSNDIAVPSYVFPLGTGDNAPLYNETTTASGGATKGPKPKKVTNYTQLNKSDWIKNESYAGVLIKTTKGTPALAIGDGRIEYTGPITGRGSVAATSLGRYNVILRLDKPIKSDGRTHTFVLYGGLAKWNNDVTGNSFKSGTYVTAGEQIGLSGQIEGESHAGLMIGFITPDSKNKFTDRLVSPDLANVMYDLLGSVDKTTGFLDASTAGYTSNDPAATSNPLDNPGSIATAAAFSSYFQMPGIMELSEAVALTGKRSLLNDKPLFPFVEQIAAGSLRNFMSMPNGDFYAFYPDYFGGLGRTAYWQIKDIEIINGRIDLSDDQLATHVFVVGDTQPSGGELGFGTIDWIDRINTAGVVNVMNAFMADFLNGPPSDAKAKDVGNTRPSLANKDAAINFLKKYGARPYYEEAPAVRSPIYETFLAYQRFCLLWASQFKTQFEFTFLPELFPGGLVEFPDHGLQCYVEQVVHNGSYESGFTTTATLSAPAAMKGVDGKPIDPDKSWVHAGMIRAFSFDADNIAHPKNAYDTPAKPPKKK